MASEQKQPVVGHIELLVDPDLAIEVVGWLDKRLALIVRAAKARGISGVSTQTMTVGAKVTEKKK